MQKVELLSPAKNIAIGMAAINNGADAVYIGAPAFSARKAAANTSKDIAVLTEYAHKYYSRVFVALNTILYDNELAEAEKIIRQLYDIGVDALIVQDMSILKMDIPPIVLHASTQMHNYDLERIKFLDSIGFQRIVLAREMSIEQIKEVRRNVKAELEVFIHGALCVSMSGQCYMSQNLFGRSANRGECAQPCRQKWSVSDGDDNILVKDKYILSLKDLNLTNHIKELVDAGVNSLKIEGRLKEESYVDNITHHYDNILNNIKAERVGSGHVTSAFIADTERTFTRGYTDYFFEKRPQNLVNAETPKSIGKRVGVVKRIKGNKLWLDGTEEIHNGDGLCYRDRDEFKGIKVNIANGQEITANEPLNIRIGTEVYRNYDHLFITSVERTGSSIRQIEVSITAENKAGHLELSAKDENDISVSLVSDELFEAAKNPSQRDNILKNLAKCGDTEFICTQKEYIGDTLFIPSAQINTLRRQLLDLLQKKRESSRPRFVMNPVNPDVLCPQNITWNYNVTNKLAETFYKEHGAQNIESGFELQAETEGKALMTTRYCILHEMGMCRKQFPGKAPKELWIHNDKQRFLLDFDCVHCMMRIIK